VVEWRRWRFRDSGEGVGCAVGVAMAELRLSQPRPEEGSSGSRGGLFEKLGSDLGALIHAPDEDYSDLTVIAGGKKVPVHRCILAARCPGLRKVLRETEESGNSKRELQLNSVVQNGTIGYEAFMAVIGYVYGGKLQPWPVAVPCYDSSCSHFTCRPAIDYVLEILCAAQLFTLPEVKTVAEVRRFREHALA
jgi:regulatory protein NPR1